MFWERIGCFYVLERAHTIIVKKTGQSLYTLREPDQAAERNCTREGRMMCASEMRGANICSAGS